MNPIYQLPQPSYQYVMSENNYLRHTVGYQQQLIDHHSSNVDGLYHDAMRWRKFKSLLAEQQGDETMGATLQRQVDTAIHGTAEPKSPSLAIIEQARAAGIQAAQHAGKQ